MLTVLSGETVSNCEGFSRREFLRVGTLGLGRSFLVGHAVSQGARIRKQGLRFSKGQIGRHVELAGWANAHRDL